MINPAELELLRQALATLAEGHADLPEFTPEFDPVAAGDVLQRVARRMQDNYPYYHPLYAGQMLKPPHAVARIAYALSLWVNPNNHALDGGRASSAMEKECVVELGRMFGWDAVRWDGHPRGGGQVGGQGGIDLSSSPDWPSQIDLAIAPGYDAEQDRFSAIEAGLGFFRVKPYHYL